MILGYCCLNNTLRNQKPSVYTNRRVIQKNFCKEKISQLVLQNVKDLKTILEWNEANNIKNFRISSEMFPHNTNGELSYFPDELVDGPEIVKILDECGQYAQLHNHSLSLHPGPFTCIASDNQVVVEKSIQDLISHNWLADALTVNSPNLPININWHVGRNWGEKVYKKFNENYQKLPQSLKNRASIENDDKWNGWSIFKLYNELFENIGCRLTLDLHHSHFSREPDIEIVEEYEMCRETWKSQIQEIHYSQSSNENKIIPAHSDYYTQPIPKWLHDQNVYVQLECKAKELALIKYRTDFN